ncbi:MAG TPA: hypothetical protein VKT83_08200 [bacterium]|nr:hypothetical protein [bacterium]
MRVGEQLVLRAPAGMIHAEAADPSIAEVTMPSSDTVLVRGIRPADTVLLLVNSTTAVAQPLRVAPALAMSGTAADAASPVGFVDLTYIPDAHAFWADVHRPGLDATISAGGWQVHLLSGGLTVVGASALQTPLQNFGVAPGAGASIRTPDGWELIASTMQSQIVHHWPLGGTNEVALAATMAGPLATLHVERGGVAVDLGTLYENGAAQSAGALTAAIGAVLVAYTFGPQGTSLSAEIPLGGWTISAATGSQGLQIGFGGSLGTGNRATVWTGSGSYGFGMTVPIGAGGTMTIAANPGGVSAFASTAESPAAGVTTTTGFGAGALTLTSPPHDVPVLASAAAFGASPATQAEARAPSLLVPYLARARIEIPAEPVAALARAPRSPNGFAGEPVSIPSGSAALILHVCLHSASPKTICDPADPTVSLRLYVDDRPIEPSGVALPIVPGPHAVAIRPEDLPQFLVPLGALTCPINATAGGIVVCDFAFRRAGAQ